MPATGEALIVANDDYADTRLSELRSPARDAEALSRVLADPRIGGFKVEVSQNEQQHQLTRRLSQFFSDRRSDELLLLHFSCHGLKDDEGHLYFAAQDTDINHLDATAVPADFVNRRLTSCRSRRIILLLDCCYSGAFAHGMTARAGSGVEIRERFEGRGRVVITASNAMEYAFEGEKRTGSGNPSEFTSALVEGLATGEADRDTDGWVSVDELYDYVADRLADASAKQRPSKWTFGLEGTLYVARNPHVSESDRSHATYAARRVGRQATAPSTGPPPTEQIIRNVWYRGHGGRVQDSKLLTREDRGTLRIASDHLHFEGRWATLQISDIRAARLKYQPADKFLAWIVVEYNGGKIAEFADGRKLGFSGYLGGTKKLLRAIQRSGVLPP